MRSSFAEMDTTCMSLVVFVTVMMTPVLLNAQTTNQPETTVTYMLVTQQPTDRPRQTSTTVTNPPIVFSGAPTTAVPPETTVPITKKKNNLSTNQMVTYLALGFMVLMFLITLFVCVVCVLKQGNENRLEDLEEARRRSTWKNDAQTAQQLAGIAEMHRASMGVTDQRLSIATKKLSMLEEKIKEAEQEFQNVLKEEEAAVLDGEEGK